MKKLVTLFALVFAATGCDLYFGPNESTPGPSNGYCALDGYYVNGEKVSDVCPSNQNESCDSNADCAAGCYCALPDDPAQGGGTCEEAGYCGEDADCADGFKCDDRSSCVPDDDVGSCNAAIAPQCTNGAPKCPEGSVPLIKDGCWTDLNDDGQFDCSTIATCDVAPACSAYQYASDCDAGDACTVVTRGINCTSGNGGACQDGQPGCVCAMYVYDSCR